jgi:serine/threonine protein kinase
VLLERINVGGMAEVFKAKAIGPEGFEKLVAIKRILPSVAEDEDFIRMFVDEAKITSALTHANLAQTFDLGKFKDTWYIAMEYVPGKDLRAVFERLKRRGDRMPLPLAAWVIARVCDGLDYAHRKRDSSGAEMDIVHRDVSPQNVIVSFEGEVKLIDFGIARSANKLSGTQAGVLKGKLGYMSPEQVRGLPMDRRSDVFAAGVVLYELCTGQRLFAGHSDYVVLQQVQAAHVPQPSKVDPLIPPELERILLKALAREPHDRYPFAADLAGDLMQFLLASRQQRVSREDLATFMKAMFPDDSAREEAALDKTPTQVARARPASAAASDAGKTAAGKVGAAGRPMSMDELAAAERSALEKQLGLHSSPSIEPAEVLDDEEHGERRVELEDTGRLDADTDPGAPAPPPPRRRSRPPREQPQAAAAAEGGSWQAELADARLAEPSAQDLDEPLELATESGSGSAAAVSPANPPASRPQASRPPPPSRPPPAPSSASRPRVAPLEEAAPPAPAPSGRRKPIAALVFAALAAFAALALILWKKEATSTSPTGLVTIVTDPEDAELSLDGAPLKDSLDRGAIEAHLAPGIEHSVGARREGFVDQLQRVQVARGEKLELRIVLQRPPGQLTIRSTPPGAQILFDGRERGATPALLSDVDAARAHVLTLEKRCFLPFKLSLAAREDVRHVSATLEPVRGPCAGQPAVRGSVAGAGKEAKAAEAPKAMGRTGFLSLASRPSASVSIDGADIGRSTPLVAWPLQPGPHAVKLSAGGLSREIAVEIRRGQTHSELVDLRKR